MEPGLRAAIDSSVLAALRERGVGPGRLLEVELVDSAVAAAAAHGGGRDGQVAFEATVTLRAQAGADCSVEVGGRRTWVLDSAQPAAAAAGRAEALRLAGDDAALRLVDALLGEPACR